MTSFVICNRSGKPMNKEQQSKREAEDSIGIACRLRLANNGAFCLLNSFTLCYILHAGLLFSFCLLHLFVKINFCVS